MYYIIYLYVYLNGYLGYTKEVKVKLVIFNIFIIKFILKLIILFKLIIL